jgi:hypothetical protein
VTFSAARGFVYLRLQHPYNAIAAKFQNLRAPMFGFLENAPKRKKLVDGIVTIGARSAPGEEPS